MKYNIITLLIINQIFYAISPIPNWGLSGQSVELEISSTYDYILYDKTENGLSVKLKKTITKDSNNELTTQNYLTIYQGSTNKGTVPVDFNDIDKQYTNKLGCGILICPKGKFHPYNFSGKTYIDQPSGFVDNGNWDLRCLEHKTGYFYVFYLLNKGKNFYYKYNGNIEEKSGFIYSDFYDFKFENENYGDDYYYKFSVLKYDGGNIRLSPDSLKVNKGNGDVNQVSKGSSKNFNQAKTYTQAYYDNNFYFYYFTFNDASDFESGYSKSYIDFSSENDYKNSVNNLNLEKKEETPLTFTENIEIKTMNFIPGTIYVYYKILNKNKNTFYFGVIDIKKNKVVYNIEENFIEFIPNPTKQGYEMFARTKNSAYKICLYKSSNSCVNPSTCSNLQLENSGNICSNVCSPGKVKLVPDGYCVNSCDENIYTLNSEKTECGLCKYINSGNDFKYKLVNTTGCISSIPINAEFYHEDSKLLKCKDNYYLDDDNNCVPDHCYVRCATCSEIGTSMDDQKCKSCTGGYQLVNENCIVPPTTIITPPSTLIINPTTEIIPSSNLKVTPTTVVIPQTTIIKQQTTDIIETPITQIPEKVFKICSNKRCDTCNEESNKIKLCLSCDETKYKKVNYTKNYSKYFNCMEEKELEIKYYYDNSSEQYKPCYKLCKKCFGPGNVTSHNCLECEDNYMFRPGYNPNHNCVVYAKYYYLSPYNEYKPLDSPICPEVAKYTLIKDNKTFCIYDCKADETHQFLYSGKCFNECPNGTSNENYICKETDPDKIYISENTIYINGNNTIEIIEILAKTYAIEFNYTSNHISTYKNDEYNLLLYKNPRIIGSTNLKVPDIDFGECYDEVKKAYNISETENLIIAIVDKKVKNNPSTFYLFFHPVSGVKLEIGDICQNKSIKMNENLLAMLDENNKNYDLQIALADQGINIFDINDPYYKDICYDFDNPKNRDMALKDRIKETYVNVTLCDDGCTNTGIDLKNKVASCDCKFNEVTDNDLIHENAAIEYLVGEFFEIINSSNILVVKCYKYLFKYFTRSVGAIIILILFVSCLTFTGLFFTYELIRMKRYIFSLTEKYTSFLTNYSNIFKLFPPQRKNIKNKTAKIQIFKPKNEQDCKDNNINSLHNDKKHGSTRTINPISLLRQQHNSKDLMLSMKKRSSQFMPLKEISKVGPNEIFMEEGRKIKRFFKEYLETSPDDMEFDDAIKRDKRGFCRYFLDDLEEKQSLAYTFIASDPINTRMIKLILFSLNITLDFVVIGLFYSEEYISELYQINEEDETFFSFIPRIFDKIIYTSLVSVLIGYLTDFFFLNENKVKGIFKREKDNKMILKRNIALLIAEIQKRYISFIIMTLVIFIISLYYILCFNYVYPKTQIEWVKSSILIIIIMQILSVLKCLYETIFRFLSFKCESEKLYKLSKLFENNLDY